jgi:hypothetical protein
VDQIAKRRILKLVVPPHSKIDLYSNQLLGKDLNESEWERLEKGQIYSSNLNRDVEIGLTHIELNKAFYHSSEKILVGVEIKDKEDQALSGLTVTANLLTKVIRLQENDPNSGEYRGELQAPLDAGSFEIIVTLRSSLSDSAARVVRDFFEVIP